MFLGHFALGFASKKAVPSVSLGTLILAGQAADLLWPSLVLAGVEKVEIAPGITKVTPLDFVSYPYSHSLLALLALGALFGLGYFLVRRTGPRPALVLFGLVVSHWLLDAASHRPDMPLTLTGPERVGLGLWFNLPATVAVELGLFGLGVLLYGTSTRPRPGMSATGLAVFVAFFVVLYAASVLSPPPPSTAAVVWSAQGLWLVVAWAYWVDSKRSPYPA